MKLADLHIFLFDLGEAIFPSRPQFDCAAVSSGGQGWPPLGGHPKGLSLTAGSTVAGFTAPGRRRSSPHVTSHFRASRVPYNVREVEAGSPSKTVLSASSESVILLTGFLVQSLLALWLYQTFHISITAAAAILFWTSICSAISYLVAVPIAERIGLINTMVFTHLPSNVLLMLVPFAPDLATAIGLLLARSALSQMDVPTRSSYVMAVVRPEERPAAASITAVPKTFAWAAGSMISGYLLTLSAFGWPLLIGGAVKAVYDLTLLVKFQMVRPPEEVKVPSR
jgi:predicted MFS family arabinose efflux permease